MEDFEKIEKKYLYPEGINEKFDLFLDRIRGVSNEEKIFFTQNLGVMLKSGLSASRSLRTLSMQTENPKFKRILIKITKKIEKGESISDSMKNFPQTFSQVFVSMIKAGEASGQLENVLEELTRQLKKSHELKNKVKGALLYPAAVFIAMTLMGIGMIIFVIPKLTAVFKEMNTDLPLPTKILISISSGLNEYIYIVAPCVFGFVGFLYWITRKGAGQFIWHKIILSMPIVADIAVKINLAKISRTLSSLMSTDMPIVQSINLTSKVITNAHYKNSLLRMSSDLEQGRTISSQMEKYPKLYPPIAHQMMQVGEETGEISSILNQLAQFYEEDVSNTMNSMPSIIEPILILVLGGAVGAMAVAIIMPMYSLANAV